ncbi:MAG: hypothetical protein WCH39_08630, partial [Schlesneria sp.]
MAPCYNLGKQLMEQGKHAEAAAHFKIAFKKDSRLMRNDFWQIMNSFQGADKLEELAAIFDDIDFKAFRQNPWEITNIISNLSYQEKSKAQAIKLFKRAWESMPDQRSQILSNVGNDTFWQMPEIYDYAREGIIPQSEASLANSKWPGFGRIHSWGNQDGKIDTLMVRFLTMAGSKKKLNELYQEIEVAKKKLPQWEGATALLSLIDLRRGNIDSAKETFEKMLPTFKAANSGQRGQYTQWEIGQELMAHEKTSELAVKYLEAASKDPNVMQMAQMNGFQYSPGKSLIAVYTKQGRKDDARRLLLSSTNIKSRQQGNEAWEAYQRLQSVTSLANEVTQLGFPMDAIRLYQEQLGRSEDFVIAASVFGSLSQGRQQMQQYKKQIQAGMQTAIKELRPELLPQMLTDRTAKPGEPDAPAIDLCLLLESRELDQAQLTSVLGKLVTSLATNTALVEPTRKSLADIVAQRSADVSVKILVALLSHSMKEKEKSAIAARQLADFVEKTPLEPQPEKGGFTVKQRDAAMQQVGLWLVARECLRDESLHADGQKLAQRAFEASRRLADNGYSFAILREWGFIALKTGDKQEAARRWTEMMDIVIPRPGDKSKQPASNDEKGDAAVAGSTDNPAKPAITGSPKEKLAVVTLGKFEQLTQLAKLAADVSWRFKRYHSWALQTIPF